MQNNGVRYLFCDVTEFLLVGLSIVELSRNLLDVHFNVLVPLLSFNRRNRLWVFGCWPAAGSRHSFIYSRCERTRENQEMFYFSILCYRFFWKKVKIVVASFFSWLHLCINLNFHPQMSSLHHSNSRQQTANHSCLLSWIYATMGRVGGWAWFQNKKEVHLAVQPSSKATQTYHSTGG